MKKQGDPAAYKEYLKSLDVNDLRDRGLTVPELFAPFSVLGEYSIIFPLAAEYTVTAYVSALENTVELGSYKENEDDGLFDDVKDPKHQYFTAIYWAVDQGITKGYPGTNLFGIDDPCTRGQAMMYNIR